MVENASSPKSGARPAISVVVPAKDEAGNLPGLLGEIETALAGRAFEVIVVDDGSGDASADLLRELAASKPWLKSARHASACGQSASVRTGLLRARGDIVVTIDGDGQNNPAYIPALVEALENASPDVGMAAGQRVGRKDTAFKRVASRIANKVRGAILRDGTRDSGCGLKAVRRDVFLRLPYFDSWHRFIPALVIREGAQIVHVDVVDRPRGHGQSKYGIWDRFWVGIWDLSGVWWLRKRRRKVPQIVEFIDGEQSGSEETSA